MINKIEHIGIAVKNIEKANLIYTELLGVGPYKSEQVASEGVITSFFKTGESKIELLEGTSAESAITKFIEKRGEGMHHIAFDVDDIEAEMNRLKNSGFTLVSEKPMKGADNKLVCFVHPKSTNGVLVELCQEIKK
jgi:methylmalonyl-CoA/ethylmalonyl-CoA epimerase